MSNENNPQNTEDTNLVAINSQPTSPKRKKNFWYWIRLATKVVLYAHLIFIVLIGILSTIYINTNPSKTVLMLYRDGFKKEKPSFVPLRNISSSFQDDLINLEDGNFREHYGIDIDAIKRAKAKNEEVGYTAQGGSTISQQLARTLFLTPHRTYFRKYLELIITFELELIVGKDRILELYINYAELGKGVYGFNDASLHYYNKPFVKTSTDQKIRMMTILASPINYSPQTLHQNKTLENRYKFIYRYR
ncbi:MAG: biosynthetic peptidoglycan transglycosylase [Saprospiraceae bacterium]